MCSWKKNKNFLLIQLSARRSRGTGPSWSSAKSPPPQGTMWLSKDSLRMSSIPPIDHIYDLKCFKMCLKDSRHFEFWIMLVMFIHRNCDKRVYNIPSFFDFFIIYWPFYGQKGLKRLHEFIWYPWPTSIQEGDVPEYRGLQPRLRHRAPLRRRRRHRRAEHHRPRATRAGTTFYVFICFMGKNGSGIYIYIHVHLVSFIRYEWWKTLSRHCILLYFPWLKCRHSNCLL